ESGIHAYVVNGYGANRLRPLVHLAQARFRREQALQEELLDVSSRFEERKMVDRAKGILMRARQMSDDDAFQILRTASMHSNQRLGQVSQHIIHSARFAESVNRAGQLRMLSQRLIKLYLLQLAGVQVTQQQERLKDSMLRIDGNLALLGKSLSKPTFGDLLGQVLLTWTRLKQALQGAPRADQMVHVDELAELLLLEAERLTGSLENAGSVAPLHVLNMAGRQRMLSQRFAKYALLGVLGDAAATARSEAGMAESSAEFEQALRYLNDIPLSTPDIRAALDAAAIGWQQLLAGATDARQPAGQETVAGASETLLEVFERLSGYYERSMQMLVG
ncbi:MAG: type IV pili methyl-accepting chemotaxis transducer N-terminal domain-containing protein, partial [Rhodoferax sp.]|nr:type IV pili methyl-accepting chemotaxis transducer N-terminal domain-containing protein [Rhodoferax sp.]